MGSPVTNKAFAFISQVLWAGTKPEPPGKAVTRPELTPYQKVLSGPRPRQPSRDPGGCLPYSTTLLPHQHAPIVEEQPRLRPCDPQAGEGPSTLFLVNFAQIPREKDPSLSLGQQALKARTLLDGHSLKLRTVGFRTSRLQAPI